MQRIRLQEKNSHLLNLLIFTSFFAPMYSRFVCNSFSPNIVPEPVARSATPGVSPGRGLLILRCESHPKLFVGLVWFGLDVRPFS